MTVRALPPETLAASPLPSPAAEAVGADAALRESEARYRALVEGAYDGIAVCDADDRILLANASFAAICGRPVSELLGANIADLVTPEHLVAAPLRSAAFQHAGQSRSECTLRRADGTIAHVELSVTLLAGGQFQCLVHDVTARRRMEDELRASERRFHGIFDSAFQFIGLLAPDGTLLEANRAALEFAGVTREEVIGRPFWDTVWWDDSAHNRARLRDAVTRAAAGEFVRFEVEHRSATGRRADVDFSLKPVFDAHGAVTLLIPEGRDVTEARLVGERLRESEETFRSAFEHSGIGIALVGLDGSWLRVNDALCDIVGYDAEELLARRFQDVTHPDDVVADLRLMEEALAGVRSSYQIEKRYIRKDGRIVWILLNVSLVRGAADAPRFFIAQAQDVTARRAAEEALERRRKELARSNAELEQFAYVASHDLQEPLRAVASYTQLLGERYAAHLDERAQKYIGYAVEGAQRMQALINDLLMLSRVGTQGQPFAPVDLNELLAETRRGMELVIAESGAIVSHDPLPTVGGDAAQLGQVLQNLVGNAIKFRRPDTPPRVHVSAVADHGEWVVSVRDNGIGIEPRFADRVFVIFKRLHTRDEYAGTGIGLAICKKVVERHGGRIWVEPAPDGGSVFRFTLPRGAAATSARRGT